MRQPFFEDLDDRNVPPPAAYLWRNGKISGSVGAVGEMQEVLLLQLRPAGWVSLHRYSARRRHPSL